LIAQIFEANLTPGNKRRPYSKYRGKEEHHSDHRYGVPRFMDGLTEVEAQK